MTDNPTPAQFRRISDFMPAYDKSHVKNSKIYHTGKECIEKDCHKPAGTYWSHLWCVDCNIARMRRIDAQFYSLMHGPVEKITGVAIRNEGIIYSLPSPSRHHHVIRYMNRKGFGPEHMIDQGFVTDKGRFVDRKEAALHARVSLQVPEIKKTDPQDELFSEDLW